MLFFTLIESPFTLLIQLEMLLRLARFTVYLVNVQVIALKAMAKATFTEILIPGSIIMTKLG